MKFIELFNIANNYYEVAINSKKEIKNNQQLKEFYTLIKISLICIDKILNDKNLIDSNLKINCLFMKSDIINEFNVEIYDLSNELIKPEYLLEEIILLASNHNSLLNFRIKAEFKLIKLNYLNKNHKISLKLIENSIFNKTSLFKFLNVLILIEIDPLKSLNFLQFLIQSNQIDNDAEIINLFLLLESMLSLSLNQTSIVNLNLINTNIPQFLILKSYLDILYQLNLNQPAKDPNNEFINLLQIKLKSFAELISNFKNLNNNFLIDFNCFGFIIPLNLHWLNYNELFSNFLLIFGISNLNTSFEKRKSLQLLNKNLSTLEENLIKFNEFNTHLNLTEFNYLNELKSQTVFYKLIELSITTGFDNEFNCLIKNIRDKNQILYLKAINSQLNNNLIEAKDHYWEIINELKNDFNNDLFILSNLNYLLIIEGELRFKNRLNKLNSELILNLTSKRNLILSNLKLIENSKNSLINFKFLIKLTIDFIYLLNNYNNFSILEINEKISNLIDPLFDYLKNYPVLLSILLYLKSFTLNENSDQKQKSSQLSFNLSKFGNQILIRYIAGLLNQSNSKIAKNLQQFDIQSSKNLKIENKINEKYSNFFES